MRYSLKERELIGRDDFSGDGVAGGPQANPVTSSNTSSRFGTTLTTVQITTTGMVAESSQTSANGPTTLIGSPPPPITVSSTRTVQVWDPTSIMNSVAPSPIITPNPVGNGLESVPDGFNSTSNFASGAGIGSGNHNRPGISSGAVGGIVAGAVVATAAAASCMAYWAITKHTRKARQLAANRPPSPHVKMNPTFHRPEGSLTMSPKRGPSRVNSPDRMGGKRMSGVPSRPVSTVASQRAANVHEVAGSYPIFPDTVDAPIVEETGPPVKEYPATKKPPPSPANGCISTSGPSYVPELSQLSRVNWEMALRQRELNIVNKSINRQSHPSANIGMRAVHSNAEGEDRRAASVSGLPIHYHGVAPLCPLGPVQEYSTSPMSPYIKQQWPLRSSMMSAIDTPTSSPIHHNSGPVTSGGMANLNISTVREIVSPEPVERPSTPPNCDCPREESRKMGTSVNPNGTSAFFSQV